MTRKPADWKVFLSNVENKTQFTQVILNVWSANEFAPQLQTRNVVAICQGHAYLLDTDDGQTTKKTEIQSPPRKRRTQGSFSIVCMPKIKDMNMHEYILQIVTYSSSSSITYTNSPSPSCSILVQATTRGSST